MTAIATPEGELVADLPGCDLSDPASVEAWHGPFGYAEPFRKVVLSACREIQRAKAALTETRVTEARLDDLARISTTYISFLTEQLEGRRVREKNVRESFAR